MKIKNILSALLLTGFFLPSAAFAQNNGQFSALLLKISNAPNGTVDLVKKALNAGADINATDENGLTPLCRAAIAKNNKIVLYLCEAGADVNAVNQKVQPGFTPMHWAALADNAEGIKIIAGKGGNINAKDAKGFTPLQYAEEMKKHNAAAALKELQNKSAKPAASEEAEEISIFSLPPKERDVAMKVRMFYGLLASDKKSAFDIYVQGGSKGVWYEQFTKSKRPAQVLADMANLKITAVNINGKTAEVKWFYFNTKVQKRIDNISSHLEFQNGDWKLDGPL